MGRGPASCWVCAPHGQTDAVFLLEAWNSLGILTYRIVLIAAHFYSMVCMETIRGSGFGRSLSKRHWCWQLNCGGEGAWSLCLDLAETRCEAKAAAGEMGRGVSHRGMWGVGRR